MVVGHVLHDVTDAREDPDAFVLILLEQKLVFFIPSVSDLGDFLESLLLVFGLVDDFLGFVLVPVEFSIVHVLELNVLSAGLIVDLVLWGCNGLVDFVPVQIAEAGALGNHLLDQVDETALVLQHVGHLGVSVILLEVFTEFAAFSVEFGD